MTTIRPIEYTLVRKTPETEERITFRLDLTHPTTGELLPEVEVDLGACRRLAEEWLGVEFPE